MLMNQTNLLRSIYIIMLIIVALCACTLSDEWDESATIVADKVMVFNGIPQGNGWGDDLVYQATDSTEGVYTMGAPWLGGIPLVDIWSEQGGVALFNISDQHELFTVQLIVEDSGAVTIEAQGGSNIVKYTHQGDYYEALREFALQMQKRGIATQSAPDWAFDPVWETYGFEETWTPLIVKEMLPLFKELGIRSITLDSGWYGRGTDDWDALAGDFPVNPDVIGTESDLIDLIETFHDEGFKVKVWWTPGVAESGTNLFASHPDWFYSKVTPSWGNSKDTGDWYLDPSLEEVRQWNINIVKRFMSYGVDGFKQDDVYEIISDDPDIHLQYSALFKDIYTMAASINPDFVINTCNCGIAQNFHHFPGENQLITSDPVGPLQFRRRAKYLHGLNINGAAVLGDHIELVEGDVGSDEIRNPAFYDKISDADFASVVALGMVLETKFTQDPGDRYRKWFALYSDYRFYDMEWINTSFFSWKPVETYLLSNGVNLYFSFFTQNEGTYTGSVELSNLIPGSTYSVYDIVNDKILEPFVAASSNEQYDISFTGCLVVEVKAQE